MNNTNKTNLARVTATIEPNLLDKVEQHRRDLQESTGIRVSTSSAISALIRAGIESPLNKMHR